MHFCCQFYVSPPQSPCHRHNSSVMLAIPVVIATLLRSSSVTRLAPPPARADADPTRGVSPHHICARSGGGSFSLLPRCQQQARGAARAWHIIVMVPSKGTTASCSQQWQSYAVSPCEDATTRSGAARGASPPPPPAQQPRRRSALSRPRLATLPCRAHLLRCQR